MKIKQVNVVSRVFIGCLLSFGFFSSSTAVAMADPSCDDLWFSRNATFDRAGYCFSTPLGQAIFDNGDCFTTPLEISDMDQRLIAEIKVAEKDFHCAVDTEKTSFSLGISDFEQRKLLDFQPVIGASEEVEWACLGYLGDPIPIYSAPSESAAPLYQLKAEDSFVQNHKDWDGWSFISVWNEQGKQQIGWAWLGDLSLDEHYGQTCKTIAG